MSLKGGNPVKQHSFNTHNNNTQLREDIAALQLAVGFVLCIINYGNWMK